MFELYDFKDGFDKADLSNWFLMPPVTFFTTIFIYILLVKVLLPKYMENKQSFQINNILIGYNAIQVVISAYLFYLSFESWYVFGKGRYFSCIPVDKSNGQEGKKTIIAMYLYFLSKYMEFLDTFFFILRKKLNQVSFLHVYHHVSTPVFTWYGLKYYPGGSFIFIVLINTFVHVVMYGYYLLSAMGPHMQRYLWWKKYITSLQLVQFWAGMGHIAFALFSSDCNVPGPVLLIYLANGFILHFLFSHFYKKQYGQKGKTEDRYNVSIVEKEEVTNFPEKM